MSAAAFEQAAQDVMKLTEPLNPEQHLELYGLFKIAKGEDIKAANTLGFFASPRDKFKRSAWQGLVDKGYTQETAQKKYVELVEKYKVSHKYDANKVPEQVGA